MHASAKLFAGAAGLIMLTSAALAADVMVVAPLPPVPAPTPQEAPSVFSAKFSAEIGVIDILANEYVWDGDWKVSQLIWETRAPVATFGFDFQLNRFTFDAGLSIAFLGDSHMEDYDWLDPYVVANGPDDWTDQSIHPDTNLAHYRSVNAALGFDVVVRDHVTVNLNTGFRYTDVMWVANGGSFVYSDGGFRDTVGVFGPGPVGTYRQQWPVLFVGLDVEAIRGPWTFGMAAQGGVTLRAGTTDEHLLRDLLIEGSLYRAPVLHLDARAERAMSPGFSVFVEGAFDKIFPARGDALYTDTITLDELIDCGDCGGADFRSMSLSVGVLLRF